MHEQLIIYTLPCCFCNYGVDWIPGFLLENMKNNIVPTHIMPDPNQKASLSCNRSIINPARVDPASIPKL